MTAEDSDIPRNLSNIVVRIHAIATFQALHDYLRPRVSGLLSSSSRLSGMLAALAASGLAPPSARFGLPEPSRSSAAAEASSSASTAGVNRRRSLRLSAKKASTSGDSAAEAPGSEAAGGGLGAETAPSDVAEGESIASAAEPAPSETVVNDDEFGGDFTDDEVDVDAEVRSLPKKKPLSLTVSSLSKRMTTLTTRSQTRPSTYLWMMVGIFVLPLRVPSQRSI